jgi:hypothetical protein
MRRASLWMLRNPLFPSKAFKPSAGLSKHVHRRQVRDQSVFDALAGSYWLEDKRFQNWRALFDDLQTPSSKRHDSLFETPMWKAVRDAGIDDDGEVQLSVNIHASDEQLIADFGKWLTEHKQRRGLVLQKNKVRSVDFQDWHRYKVLPYLDLKFWAKTHGLEITNQLLGIALFPDEYEVALSDRIRKVVTPLGRRLANEEFCTLLRAQAQEELAESKSTDLIPSKYSSISWTDDGRVKLAPDV